MTDLNWVAIHESGHAVAHHRLFPDDYFVEVRITPSDDSLGLIELSLDPTELPVTTPEHQWADARSRDAVIACAGYAACILAGYSEEQARKGCESDFERAGPQVEDARKAARELLGSEKNIRAVRLVADRLLEFRVVDYDHFLIMMQLADGECAEDEYQEYLRNRKQLGQPFPTSTLLDN